jgi:hypothetical protein
MGRDFQTDFWEMVWNWLVTWALDWITQGLVYDLQNYAVDVYSSKEG